MKTEFTPGPWICHSGMVWKEDGSEEGIPIARMAREDLRTLPVERDANARLIATAPELLTTLEYLRKHYSEKLTANSLCIVDEIIARAKGTR
jgi:hypothetical protein